MKKPYKVEIDNAGCPNCGGGKTWSVLQPDGYLLGVSYSLRESAEDLAMELNRAFRFGKKEGAKNVSHKTA